MILEQKSLMLRVGPTSGMLEFFGRASQQVMI